MKWSPATITATVVIVAVAGLTASALPRIAFTMYDEGVYYYQAVLLSRGEVPYRDFFCPQPPGLLLLGAASERLGAGLIGVRVLNWLCGFVLLWQTWLLTRRLLERAEAASGFASSLVAVTVVFAYQSIQGATNVPAACLELAAGLLVLGEDRRRFVFAGLVLATATLLRLQCVVAVPGLLLLAWFAHGRTGFWQRTALLLGALGIACVAIHGTLALTLPGYVNNAVGFQTARMRTDWSDRGQQMWELLQEPCAAMGLPAALWFAVRGKGRLRGVALHALATTGVISVAGNSLSVMYYLPAIPLLAACAAVGLTRLTQRVWVFAMAPLVVAALRGWWVATIILTQTSLNDDHDGCVRNLQVLSGNTVLTSDGRIAVLAGKRGVPDYYATDPNALHLVKPERFHEWFATVIPKADVIVVTPQLLMWMSPENAAAVRASGKPVLFDRRSSRASFEAMCGPIP